MRWSNRSRRSSQHDQLAEPGQPHTTGTSRQPAAFDGDVDRDVQVSRCGRRRACRCPRGRPTSSHPRHRCRGAECRGSASRRCAAPAVRVAREPAQPDVRLGSADLVPEQGRERAAARSAAGGRAVLDDHAASSTTARSATRPSTGAGRDQHRPSRQRRAQVSTRGARSWCRRPRADRRGRARAPRDECASERHALALPAGEVHAALADERFVALRQVVANAATPAASQAASTPPRARPGAPAQRFSRSVSEKSTGAVSRRRRRSAARPCELRDLDPADLDAPAVGS